MTGQPGTMGRRDEDPTRRDLTTKAAAGIKKEAAAGVGAEGGESGSAAAGNVLKGASASTTPGYVPYGKSVIHSGPVNVSKAIDVGNLKGKTILITGGASGFGASCSKLWATHGANIIIGDINTSLGTALIASLRQLTGNAHHHFIHLDVTSWASQAQFFREAATLSPHGGIDTVMANAGIADAEEQLLFEDPPDYSGVEAPPPPGLRTYETNLTGVLYTTHLALSYLARNPGSGQCSLESKDGKRDRHLLLVASIAGLAGLPGSPLYAAAKHGVVGLFRTLRLTSPAMTGVRVNMINPYFVDTPILGPLGSFVLAGGAMASLSSVVSACTRLVADQSIIGRALMIGSGTSTAHARQAGLESESTVEQQDVWDCYADDFEQSDLFTRRIIAVTNLVTGARGWVGFFGDIGRVVGRKVWGALGY